MIQIYILNGNQCRSRSVGFFRSQLIWIYTVYKDRVYPGSTGQGEIYSQTETQRNWLIKWEWIATFTIAPDVYFWNKISGFSLISPPKIRAHEIDVGIHWNQLTKAIPISTHNNIFVQNKENRLDTPTPYIQSYGFNNTSHITEKYKLLNQTRRRSPLWQDNNNRITYKSIADSRLISVRGEQRVEAIMNSLIWVWHCSGMSVRILREFVNKIGHVCPTYLTLKLPITTNGRLLCHLLVIWKVIFAVWTQIRLLL